MTSLRPVLARLTRFAADERGATAIEYAMIAALIAGAILSTVFAMGKSLNQTFYGPIANALTSS